MFRTRSPPSVSSPRAGVQVRPASWDTWTPRTGIEPSASSPRNATATWSPLPATTALLAGSAALLGTWNSHVRPSSVADDRDVRAGGGGCDKAAGRRDVRADDGRFRTDAAAAGRACRRAATASPSRSRPPCRPPSRRRCRARCRRSPRGRPTARCGWSRGRPRRASRRAPCVRVGKDAPSTSPDTSSPSRTTTANWHGSKSQPRHSAAIPPSGAPVTAHSWSWSSSSTARTSRGAARRVRGPVPRRRGRSPGRGSRRPPDQPAGGGAQPADHDRGGERRRDRRTTATAAGGRPVEDGVEAGLCRPPATSASRKKRLAAPPGAGDVDRDGAQPGLGVVGRQEGAPGAHRPGEGLHDGVLGLDRVTGDAGELAHETAVGRGVHLVHAVHRTPRGHGPPPHLVVCSHHDDSWEVRSVAPRVPLTQSRACPPPRQTRPGPPGHGCSPASSPPPTRSTSATSWARCGSG